MKKFLVADKPTMFPAKKQGLFAVAVTHSGTAAKEELTNVS